MQNLIVLLCFAVVISECFGAELCNCYHLSHTKSISCIIFAWKHDFINLNISVFFRLDQNVILLLITKTFVNSIDSWFSLSHFIMSRFSMSTGDGISKIIRQKKEVPDTWAATGETHMKGFLQLLLRPFKSTKWKCSQPLKLSKKSNDQGCRVSGLHLKSEVELCFWSFGVCLVQFFILKKWVTQETFVCV